jgi:hypothetical protein
VSIFVFVSHPQPSGEAQARFIEELSDYLRARSLVPRTLGVTDYDMNAPLTAIRRVLLECNGIITVALRRMRVDEGRVLRRGGAGQDHLERVSGSWLTSPWSHIEPAMAYQLGLPIMHVREKDVLPDGLLERGVVGLCGPEFDLDRGAPADYLTSPEWVAVSGQWEGYVRSVFDRKGWPPMLHGSPPRELRG